MRDQDNQDHERAAILAAFAASPSPTSLGPVYASVGHWMATSPAQLREGLHTLAAEAVCDAGEWAMKRRYRRARRQQRGTSGAPVAEEARA
jgi:hypothetical protein